MEQAWLYLPTVSRIKVWMKGMTFHLNKREFETAFHVSSCEAGLLTGNLRTNGTHRSTGLREREVLTERKTIFRVTYDTNWPKPLQYKMIPVLRIEGDATLRASKRYWWKNHWEWPVQDQRHIEPQRSGRGTSQMQCKQNFKAEEIRITKIPLVVKCKICAGFVTFYFSGVL